MNKILKISTILSGMIVSLSSPLLVYADASPSNTNGGGTIVTQDDGTTRTLRGNALVVTEQPENVPSFDRDEAKTNAQDLKTNIQVAKAQGITPEDVKTNAQTKAENAKAEGKTLPENFKEIESKTSVIKSKKVDIATKAKSGQKEIADDAISPENIDKVEDYAGFNQMKREKIKEKRNSKKGS